jgi:hypothetical protein
VRGERAVAAPGEATTGGVVAAARPPTLAGSCDPWWEVRRKAH